MRIAIYFFGLIGALASLAGSGGKAAAQEPLDLTVDEQSGVSLYDRSWLRSTWSDHYAVPLDPGSMTSNTWGTETEDGVLQAGSLVVVGEGPPSCGGAGMLWTVEVDVVVAASTWTRRAGTSDWVLASQHESTFNFGECDFIKVDDFGDGADIVTASRTDITYTHNYRRMRHVCDGREKLVTWGPAGRTTQIVGVCESLLSAEPDYLTHVDEIEERGGAVPVLRAGDAYRMDLHITNGDRSYSVSRAWALVPTSHAESSQFNDPPPSHYRSASSFGYRGLCGGGAFCQ